jgi:hypothetical protein
VGVKYYVLKGNVAFEEPDLIKWAQLFQKADRKVRHDIIQGASISTVFLGIDHAFHGQEKPVLFETMVFGGALDQETSRCCTWEQAELMHQAMCDKVRVA